MEGRKKRVGSALFFSFSASVLRSFSLCLAVSGDEKKATQCPQRDFQEERPASREKKKRSLSREENKRKAKTKKVESLEPNDRVHRKKNSRSVYNSSSLLFFPKLRLSL